MEMKTKVASKNGDNEYPIANNKQQQQQKINKPTTPPISLRQASLLLGSE